MSHKSNQKKQDQLGMSVGTASHRLRKMLLFAFVQDACLDTCFRCGKKITKLSEFSIDHKTPWLDGDDPAKLFFDLENIAFSHLACNVGDARQPNKACSEEERLARKASTNRKWRKSKEPTVRKARRRAKYLRTGT